MFFCKLLLPCAIPISQTLQYSAWRATSHIQTPCQNPAEALANPWGLNEAATLCARCGEGEEGEKNKVSVIVTPGSEWAAPLLIAWDRHRKRPPVQSAGLESQGRVDEINKSQLSHGISSESTGNVWIWSQPWPVCTPGCRRRNDLLWSFHRLYLVWTK